MVAHSSLDDMDVKFEDKEPKITTCKEDAVSPVNKAWVIAFCVRHFNVTASV